MLSENLELENLAKLLITKTEEVLQKQNKDDSKKTNLLEETIQQLKKSLATEQNKTQEFQEKFLESENAYRLISIENKRKDSEIQSLKNEINSLKEIVLKRNEHIESLKQTISELRDNLSILNKNKSNIEESNTDNSETTNLNLEINQIDETQDKNETSKETEKTAEKTNQSPKNKAVIYEYEFSGNKFPNTYSNLNSFLKKIGIQYPLLNFDFNFDFDFINPKKFKKTLNDFFENVEEKIYEYDFNTKKKKEKQISEIETKEIENDFINFKKLLTDLELL